MAPGEPMKNAALMDFLVFLSQLRVMSALVGCAVQVFGWTVSGTIPRFAGSG
jgi:hypothetical protein